MYKSVNKELMVIDHINRNKLDNRRSNLRLVTRAQNNQNRTTGDRFGITFKNQKWYFQINYKGQHYSGVSESKEDAQRLYDSHALYLYSLDSHDPKTIFEYTAKEKLDIIKEMALLSLKKVKASGLPKNITKYHGNYLVKITNKKYNFIAKQAFKFLEDALIFRDVETSRLDKIVIESKTELLKIPIERNTDAVAVIPLYKGKDKDRKIVGYSLVDDDSYYNINEKRWTMRIDGYPSGKIDNKNIMLHQFVMGPYPAGKPIIDHINGNKLDNRKQNLRFCTCAENNSNNAVTRAQKECPWVFKRGKNAGLKCVRFCVKDKELCGQHYKYNKSVKLKVDC